MITRALLLVVVSLGLVACSGQHTDLQAYMDNIRQGAVPNAEPLPPLPALSHTDYYGREYRDPFVTMPTGQAREPAPQSRNCPQPPRDRVPSVLQQVGLDQMSLRGVFNRDGARIALIVTNDGRLHRVAVGDYLGLNFGRVSGISSDRVTLREWIATGDGCWQQQETYLSLAVPAGGTNS